MATKWTATAIEALGTQKSENVSFDLKQKKVAPRACKVPQKLSQAVELQSENAETNVLSQIWLKPGVFEYVEDCCTHLRAYHRINKKFYTITATEE